MQRALFAVLLTAVVGCTPRSDEPPASATFALDEVLGGADTLHERATAPRTFSFPADHGPHPAFRTEWWYFTGNLATRDGREFGYQLTFFRSALADTASFSHAADTLRSAWRTRHAYMAHFAVSDIAVAEFHAAERFGRGALGLAGARATPFAVWLDHWRADGPPHGSGIFPLRLVVTEGGVAIDLVLEAGKPVVLQGEDGLSRKSPEPGNASYYYSLTRMPTTGTIGIGGSTHAVSGNSWLDREWSTSVLGRDLAGWDWLSLQLDDGTELMLYRLRRHDGSAAPLSAGTHVAADGSTSRLASGDFMMSPQRTWPSPLDGAAYPIDWQVRVPSLDLALDVRAAFPAQELNHAVRYWEGAVRASGRRGAAPVSGRGYLELTGYGTPSAPPEPGRRSARRPPR